MCAGETVYKLITKTYNGNSSPQIYSPIEHQLDWQIFPPISLSSFFYFFCRSIHTAPGCCSQLPSFLSHLLFFFFFILLLSLSLSLCLISFFLLDSSLFSSGFIFFYLFFNPFPSLSFSVPSIKPLHATHLDLSPPTFFLNGNPKLYTLSPPISHHFPIRSGLTNAGC